MSDVKQRFSQLDCNEAYSIAMIIEDEGSKFFASLVENTDDPRVKNELAYLEEEEQKHRKTFEEFLKKRTSKTVACSDDKVNDWVKEEVVEPLKCELPESGKEALRLGLAYKDQIISFLEEIRSAEDDPENEKAIDEIIEEEKKQRKKLNIILAY